MKKPLLVAVLLLSSIIILVSSFSFEPASANISSSFVFDHFDGNAIDTAKWTVEQGSGNSSGSVTVADSYVSLTSDNWGFPRVVSAVNPFPTSGDFALEFDITFTRITSAGTGIWVSQGPFIPHESNVNANIMQVWASTMDGVTICFLTHDVYQDDLYTHPTPFGYWNTSAIIIKLQYSKGVYTLFLNGAEVARGESVLRPDVFGLGIPPFPGSNASHGGPWTSFKLDAIRILPPSQITLSVSPSAIGGFKVDASGTLADIQGTPLSGATVFLSSRIPGLSEWNQLTSTTTNAEGAYDATWFPPATGNFSLKAEWQGDAEHAGTFECKNVSVTRGTGETVFLAESNSTLSSLAFNSDSKEIRFTASGPSGTRGYVRFVVSKMLLENLTEFQVYLDGQQVKFVATSEGDSQILYFQYSHSSHDILIKLLHSENLAPAEFSTPTTFPLLEVAVVIAVVSVSVAIGVAVRRRRKVVS